LFVSATDVETGRPLIFDNAAIDAGRVVRVSLSAFVFPAVRSVSGPYWMVGYSAIRAGTLLRPVPAGAPDPDHEQSHARSGVPSTPTEITNRLNEIAVKMCLRPNRRVARRRTLTSYDARRGVGRICDFVKIQRRGGVFHKPSSKLGGTPVTR